MLRILNLVALLHLVAYTTGQGPIDNEIDAAVRAASGSPPASPSAALVAESTSPPASRTARRSSGDDDDDDDGGGGGGGGVIPCPGQSRLYWCTGSTFLASYILDESRQCCCTCSGVDDCRVWTYYPRESLCVLWRRCRARLYSEYTGATWNYQQRAQCF